MRIVHTSDWHAGQLWKSRNRLDEFEAILDDLGGFIEHERVDLLLVSGDIFDVGAPTAEAERVVFRFLRRLDAPAPGL
jgi:DNA repair protein SbcD/Mre11